MSALAKDPKGRTQVTPQKRIIGGALSKDPKRNPGFKLGGSYDDLMKQKAKTEQEIARRGKAGAGGYGGRLDQINKALSGMQPPAAAPAPVDPATDGKTSFDEATQGGNEMMNMLYGQMQSRGDFAPGDYSQQRQRAEESVMGTFNRRMDPQFQKEEADFRQMMAERGIPETSDQFAREYQNMKRTQNDARLDAMDRGVQLGQGEQAQAFGQQVQTYQMPYANMSAFNPMYAQQGAMQQLNSRMDFEKRMGESDQQHQMRMEQMRNQHALQQIKATPRGGGGGGGGGQLTMADRLQLMNQEFYNNLALIGMQNGQQTPLPGVATGVTQGVASGVGAGVTAGLGGGLR